MLTAHRCSVARTKWALRVTFNLTTEKRERDSSVHSTRRASTSQKGHDSFSVPRTLWEPSIVERAPRSLGEQRSALPNSQIPNQNETVSRITFFGPLKARLHSGSDRGARSTICAEDRFMRFKRSGVTEDILLTRSNIGNISNVNRNGTNTARGYNTSHGLTTVTGGTTQTYDTDGNTTTLHTNVTAAWDDAGRMRNTNVPAGATAGIQGLNENGYVGGNRIWKKITRSGSVVEHRVHIHAGPNLVAEYNAGVAASTPVQEYVYGDEIDSLVLIRRSDATKYGVTRNRQWSITALHDLANGSVVERYAYEVTGKRTIYAANGTTVRTTSSYGNNFGYTNRWHDDDSGLMYFRARYYNPLSGEFLRRDPLLFVSGRSLYRGYMGFGLVDPSGLKPERVCWDFQNPLYGNLGGIMAAFEKVASLMDWWKLNIFAEFYVPTGWEPPGSGWPWLPSWFPDLGYPKGWKKVREVVDTVGQAVKRLVRSLISDFLQMHPTLTFVSSREKRACGCDLKYMPVVEGGEREEKPANGGQRGSITTIGNEIGGWVSLSMVLNTTDDLDECVFKDPGLRNPRLGPASPNNLIPGEGCDESWTSEGAMILSVGVDFHWEALTVSVPIKLNFSFRTPASFAGTCTNGKPCPAPK